MFIYGYQTEATFFTNGENVFINPTLAQSRNIGDTDKIKNRIYKTIYIFYFIKQDNLGDIDVDVESPSISRLEFTTNDKVIVKAVFTNKTKELEVYKTAGFNSFWYLFIIDSELGNVNTFKLPYTLKINSTEKYHKTLNSCIDTVLKHAHFVFFEDGSSFKITIKVYLEIAIYCKNRDFLQSNKIEKGNKNNSLVVGFGVSHDEDTDNIVRSWPPHVGATEPQDTKKNFLMS